MASFLAQYRAVNSDDMADKIEMAVIKKARAEVANANSTTLRRFSWNVLRNSKAYKFELTKAVISHLDKAAPTDLEIENALNVLFPLFALGEGEAL